METVNAIQSQLLHVVEDLSPVQQEEVLDFALFLKERQMTWGWDSITDERAAALKAEFAGGSFDDKSTAHPGAWNDFEQLS